MSPSLSGGCVVLYGIVGAGGFAREVAPIARHWVKVWHGDDGGELVFVVEEGFGVPATINGLRTQRLSEFLAFPGEKRYTVAIADSRVRGRIADAMPADVRPFPVIAPNHVGGDDNVIGEGAILCGFTHVTSNARIGRFFHGNIYSYVAHDCVIGDFVTFAPGVKCNGRVIVEDHAYIGTGAVIRDGTDRPIVIGRGAVVGMGAVVTKSVPAGATVAGNPARPLSAA